jgi:hypothetical protein
VVLFNYPAAEDAEPIQIRIYFPGNDDDDNPSGVVDVAAPAEVQAPDWMTDVKPEHLLRTFALPIGFMSLAIEKTGKFRVRVAKGDKIYRLEALEVIVADAASSSTETDGGAS